MHSSIILHKLIFKQVKERKSPFFCCKKFIFVSRYNPKKI
ncbi:hypothetical protein BACDOR_04371 [Phocaeicola dorei DSM 17855]|uniref:Uncharacterized protein n=1 Tax=Phocaeicola dorei DSM 17855 TaxID=483217 RepID=B6W474_9BACT|nr:hypothetical protein BACDOR_04371 [Phocaeicola dorei DSM 17855]